jgi:hypothetical protein
MDVFTLFDVGDSFADILPVFPNRLTGFDINERDLMADWHIHIRLKVERGVVVRDDAKHIRASLEILNDNHSDSVFLLVD